MEQMKSSEINDFIRNNLHLSNADLSQATGISVNAIEHRIRRLGLKRESIFDKKIQAEGFTSSWEHGWLKTDTASIFIRNEKGFVTYDEMREELIEELKSYAPTYPKIEYKKITDGHLLIIDPADIHIGKLALKEETGNSYNIKIAKKRCIEGVNGIIEKAKGFPIERIIFVIGNDVMHTDNPFRTTTSGTKQDTDGQWWQMFREAKTMYVEIIENLLTIAPVHVVFCPSNHDYASGFMLADTLSSWFFKNEHCTFDVEIRHRKYLQYGDNLLGFSHGDGAKEGDAKALMADEAPHLWSKTKYRYIYLHHIHHKKKINYLTTKDYIGLTVEYLRSPSGDDSWHDRNGYKPLRAVEGFIHSKKQGQCARLTHYF